MATLEQVEKLRERTNVSYDEAKAALAAANGDLLDAVIRLEKEGRLNPPANGGYYSNEKTDGQSAGQAPAAGGKTNIKAKAFRPDA
jgi:hypothetical protein